MVSATGRVIRSGRSTTTVSAKIYQGQALDAPSAKLFGSAMITYSKIEGIKTCFGSVFKERWHIDFQMPGGASGFEGHVIDQTGLRFKDKKTGAAVLNMTEYVRNSFGSLQGGMIAIMADAAGQLAARSATGLRLTTVDLIINYLSPGRRGPFTTDARVLRSDGSSALSRVEIKDAGDDHRIIAVAMNTAALAGNTPKESA
jgi:uncharacterized protein (TIGR00369 family)